MIGNAVLSDNHVHHVLGVRPWVVGGADRPIFAAVDESYASVSGANADTGEDAIEPLWKGQRFPLGQCISGWAMLNKRSVAIEDIYVDPGARAVGLGETLMNHLIDWCRARGCFGVDSLALPGDRDTKNFFESFGLVARAIVVHRPLS